MKARNERLLLPHEAEQRNMGMLGIALGGFCVLAAIVAWWLW